MHVCVCVFLSQGTPLPLSSLCVLSIVLRGATVSRGGNTSLNVGTLESRKGYARDHIEHVANDNHHPQEAFLIIKSVCSFVQLTRDQ